MTHADRNALPTGAMPLFGSDAYSPRDIALRVRDVGVAKARLPLLSTVLLAMLAGAFIGLGSLYYVVVVSDPELGWAARRVLGGAVFSLGLILVVVAGAELFTGNNLLAMAWVERRISTRELLLNWTVVFLGNFTGAVLLGCAVFLSGHLEMNGGAVGRAYVSIAAAKTSLPFAKAFFSGVLCNVLVCMAVWMTLAARSVTDKVIAVIFPISAFVAAGFEHSVANMYLLPLAMTIQASLGQPLDYAGLARNLVPVVAGNLVGGSVLVALVYYFIYRWPPTNAREGAEMR